MLKNYIKVAFRNVFRHKGYSLINVAGLAVGIACCMLILLWVQHEVSFDKFHENGDDICIVAQHVSYGDRMLTGITTAPALGPVLVEEFPDIVTASRFNQANSVTLSYKDNAFYENINAVDPDFLRMFTFPLISGDAEVALNDPHSIILSEDMVRKYFADEDPLGKVITVEGRHPYKVAGVMQNPPSNSTMQFGFLIPFTSLEEIWNDPGYPESWTNWNARLYVQLSKGTSYEAVSTKISGRLQQVSKSSKVTLFLQPYTKLHLHGLGTVGGGILLVILFTLIAGFILGIACVNFMNLSTARSASRAREIGMRKVSGASRVDIILQFYTESFLISAISLFAAIALVELFLPVFNGLINKDLAFDFISNKRLSLSAIGLMFLTTFVAGSYPALYMSLFQPAKIVKGGLGPDSKSSRLRKGLVIVQFTLSVVLIIVTSVIMRQVDYMRTVDLGFNDQELVYFRMKGDIKDHYEIAKNRLLQHPNIHHVSPTSRTPAGVYTNGSGWEWDGKADNVNPLVTYFYSDADFLNAFEAKVADGKFYPEEHSGGSSSYYGEVVINETFARMIGSDEVIGSSIRHSGSSYEVIGVIKDFNFKPLYQSIEPMILFLKTHDHVNRPKKYNYMFARIGHDDVQGTLSHIESVYREFDSDLPYSVTFMSDIYDTLYGGQERIADIIKYSAGLALIISCLGLFGLATFTTEQRTKEIGIRKVLGASVSGIIGMLSKQVVLQIVIANIVGGSTAFVFMSGYLREFAYRTPIGWQPFAVSILVTMSVAMLSVSIQAVRAALANPVDTLRHE